MVDARSSKSFGVSCQAASDVVSVIADLTRAGAGAFMARPQRYPQKVEFWTTQQQWDALQLLTADQLTDTATQMRQALSLYLRHLGITVAPRPAQPNGQHQQQEQSH